MELAVEDEAIDELDHVNNAAYLQYVERIARAHSVHLGLTTARFLELGGMFVVRRHEVLYHSPALAGDVLKLTTYVSEMSGSKCTRHVAIWRRGELLVSAATEWVWIDADTRRPKRLPAEIREAFSSGPIA